MFEKIFDLRYFEVNRYGEASPTTMLMLLEEAAAEHCLSIGQGLFQLSEQNIGWVLLSGYLQMERYPRYKEKITIKTWISTYSSIKGNRENIIYDEQGSIIGRGKGLWLFFDIQRRKPARVFDAFLDKWSCLPEESISHDITNKIIPIESAKYKQTFLVHKYDIDSYKHLNNIRYLQWLLETIPDEIVDNYYMHSIDGRFINEAHLGHTVESLADNEKDTCKFVHTIRDVENNQVCSTGKTVWKRRA